MSFFDPLSFTIGIGVGAGVGGGASAYFLRKRLRPDGEDEEERSGREVAKEYISPQADRRYSPEIAQFFLHNHIAGDEVALPEVLIEPRFLQNKPPTLIIEEDETVLEEIDFFRVIPFLHDYPAVYSSFNMDTYSIRDLESGNPHVALLGIPGTGKSTALMALGLLALGIIDADDLKGPQYGQMDDDEDDDESVPEATRERRRREREESRRRAIEQLRISQHRQDEMAEVEKRDEAVNFEDLVPVYVHVRHVDLNPETYGGKIDPAEPFGKALSSYVSKNTAVLAVPLIYKMMRSGNALILIDGFEDLTPDERVPYLHWLKALVELYGDNFIAVTGPPTGYDGLVQSGFAPAFVSPLTTQRFEELIQKWVAHWEEIEAPADERLLGSLASDNRNRTILEVITKLWALRYGSPEQDTHPHYYENYIRQHLGDIPGAFEVVRDASAYWLDHGHPPDRETLQQIIAGGSGEVENGFADEATDELEDDALDDLWDDEEGDGSKEKKKSKKDDKSKAKKINTSEADKILEQLAALNILLQTPDGGLILRHPVLGWVAAAQSLVGAGDDRILQVGANPNWQSALRFAAAAGVDLTPAVLKRLQDAAQNPDLLFSSVFSIAEWMPESEPGVRWKAETLKRLRPVLLSPGQYPPVRQHALAALVTSREYKDVAFIFREAVRSGNSHVRMLGCLGLGAISNPEAVADLTPMLLDDVAEVQLSAGLALGAIGNDDAHGALADALLTGDEVLRKVVAEALSSIPGVGHLTLKEGIKDKDMNVRRACVFGLARIPETWALSALYDTMMEDTEWYVKSAAEHAFARAREPRKSGPRHYPEPHYYRWLTNWAEGRGQTVEEGEEGRNYLLRALEEGPPKVRTEAAHALGSLGHVPAVKSLYSILDDVESEVRLAAVEALGQLSARFGQPLPGI